MSSWRDGMLHFPANFLSGSARAFADAFAKATHTLAQFFSTFDRLAARNVLAETFATASGALTALLVRATDASVFPPVDITDATATTVLILVLLILHAHPGPSR
jgi:hypothetical protein